MIEIQISDSSFGTKRKVVFDSIKHFSYTTGDAIITWAVYHYDSEGNMIDNVEINQGRTVDIHINNYNKVNDQGIMIVREDFDTDEDYQQAYDAGHREFDFWWEILKTTPFPVALRNGSELLNQLNRFDR